MKLSLSSLGKFNALSHCFAAETRFKHQSRALIGYRIEVLMFRDILSDFPLLEDRLFHPENKEAINSFFAGEMKVSQLLRTKTFTLPQETLQVLKAVVEIFEEEKEGNRKEIEEEVKAVCKKDDLVILMNMLPHITTLMEWTLKQETSFRVVTHGDFHQWNLAFNSEALFSV